MTDETSSTPLLAAENVSSSSFTTPLLAGDDVEQQQQQQPPSSDTSSSRPSSSWWSLLCAPLTDETGNARSVVTGLSTLIVAGSIVGIFLVPHDAALHPPWYRVTSAAIGYIYFLAWSLSFYPQVMTNWRRQNTQGLSVDFCYLNVLGFACYTAYTVALYASPSIRREYRARHHHEQGIPVESNDVAFCIHALLLSSITVGQILWYGRHRRRWAAAFQVTLVVQHFIGLLLVWIGFIGPMLVVSGYWHTLDYLYSLSFIKVLISLCKYMPQVLLNRRRQSTVGWSIWQILLDLTGGLLSDVQLVGDTWATTSAGRSVAWAVLTGNPAKLALGTLSMAFDVIFMIQHYILYPALTRMLDTSEEDVNDSAPLVDADDDNDDDDDDDADDGGNEDADNADEAFHGSNAGNANDASEFSREGDTNDADDGDEVSSTQALNSACPADQVKKSQLFFGSALPPTLRVFQRKKEMTMKLLREERYCSLDTMTLSYLFRRYYFYSYFMLFILMLRPSESFLAGGNVSFRKNIPLQQTKQHLDTSSATVKQQTKKTRTKKETKSAKKKPRAACVEASDTKKKINKKNKGSTSDDGTQQHWTNASDFFSFQLLDTTENEPVVYENLKLFQKDREDGLISGAIKAVSLAFTIRGNPLPLRRHRTSRGFMYNPSAKAQLSFRNETSVLLYGLDSPSDDKSANTTQISSPLDRPLFSSNIPLSVTLILRLRRPLSHFRSSKRETRTLKANAPAYLATTSIRSDADNLAKFVLDAFNGLLYDDDRQIQNLQVLKMLDNEGECLGSTQVFIQSITETMQTSILQHAMQPFLPGNTTACK